MHQDIPQLLAWRQPKLVADHRKLFRATFDLIVQLPIPFAVIVEHFSFALLQLKERAHALQHLSVDDKLSHE